jgi:hypothetical protein
MLALAEGWASQSNSPLSAVIAQLERIIGSGEFIDTKAFPSVNLETFKVGQALVGHGRVVHTLAAARRHLGSGTAEGEEIAHAALKAIWVSAGTVRAYCRDRQILAPECIRKASLRPKLALENAAAVHVGLPDVPMCEDPKTTAAPPRFSLHRSLEEADAPFVERALALMEDDKQLSVWAAVNKLEGELPGHGTVESRRQRIHKRVSKAVKTTRNESKDSKTP